MDSSQNGLICYSHNGRCVLKAVRDGFGLLDKISIKNRWEQ